MSNPKSLESFIRKFAKYYPFEYNILNGFRKKSEPEKIKRKNEIVVNF